MQIAQNILAALMSLLVRLSYYYVEKQRDLVLNFSKKRKSIDSNSIKRNTICWKEKKGLYFTTWACFRCAAGLDLSECFEQQELHGLVLSLFKVHAVMLISASLSGAQTSTMNLFWVLEHVHSLSFWKGCGDSNGASALGSAGLQCYRPATHDTFLLTNPVIPADRTKESCSHL